MKNCETDQILDVTVKCPCVLFSQQDGEKCQSRQDWPKTLIETYSDKNLRQSIMEEWWVWRSAGMGQPRDLAILTPV